MSPAAKRSRWLVATADLYLYRAGVGTAPVLAYRAGDRITSDVVDANPEWAAQVRPETPAPSQPEGEGGSEGEAASRPAPRPAHPQQARRGR
jgi:hypothetical protein